MITFFSHLEARIREIDSLLCIGLDPHPNDLPHWTGTAVEDFCIKLIDSTAYLTAAYKPNIAFFEALGPEGMGALINVISAIPDEIPVILDAKRGDISSTAKAYVQAVFETIGADAVTINPYLGKDAVDPFISNPERGVFMLCKTSNPGSVDIQDLKINIENDLGRMPKNDLGENRLYVHIAQLAQAWNVNDNLGIVVGATQSKSLARVRQVAPELWILAPGVGAQGGDLHLSLKAGLRSDGLGMLIPISRGIARAENPHRAAKDFRDAINEQRYKLDLNQSAAYQVPINTQKMMIAEGLLEAGCIKFGSFTLKSGNVSPIYIDLRRLVGYPKLLTLVAEAYIHLLVNLRFEQLAALPYAALPITSAISMRMGWPMLYPRKEIKEYGTKAQIEGVFKAGQTAAVIDDLISTGGSKFEGIEKLESAGITVKDVVVLIDRSSDRGAELLQRGYKLHAVLTIMELLAIYDKSNLVDSQKIAEAREFISEKP